MKAYQLTTAPALLDIGKAGKAAVRSSVPFWVGSALHCADYLHNVDGGHRGFAVFRAHDGAPASILTVWPSK